MSLETPRVVNVLQNKDHSFNWQLLKGLDVINMLYLLLGSIFPRLIMTNSSVL